MNPLMIKPIVTLPLEITKHVERGFDLSVCKLMKNYLAQLTFTGQPHYAATATSPKEALEQLELALIEREAQQERDGLEEAEIERARDAGKY